MGETKVQKVDRELPCQLSDSEKQEKGEMLAQHETAEEDDKAKRSVITSRIRVRRKEEISPLVKAIEAGEETRIVKCEVRLNFAKQSKVTVRLDTKAIVEEEAMTADEINDTQTTMPE